MSADQIAAWKRALADLRRTQRNQRSRRPQPQITGIRIPAPAHREETMSNRRKATATCPCADCGTVTARRGKPSEWYMVRDDIWEAAGMPPMPVLSIDTFAEYRAYIEDIAHRFLCIGCLEARLGRQLTADDFTGVEVNDPERTWQSDRLASRIRGAL
jgi:hypothetical protein